jgi:hypothetical protein
VRESLPRASLAATPLTVAAAFRADDLDRCPNKRDHLVLASSQKAIADEGNGIILAYFGELDGLRKIRP